MCRKVDEGGLGQLPPTSSLANRDWTGGDYGGNLTLYSYVDQLDVPWYIPLVQAHAMSTKYTHLQYALVNRPEHLPFGDVHGSYMLLFPLPSYPSL